MLHDSPPHSVTLYTTTNTKDAGGGRSSAFTSAQAGVPCLINTASAGTQLRYAQQQIVVSHTIGILSSVLTTTPGPGWKVVADDTSGVFMVRGIRSGRVSALGGIPALTYLDCEQVL